MKSKRGYFNVEEVAEIFGEKPATVRRWAREGHIPARKIGNQWYFSRISVYQEKSEGDAAEILGKGAERQENGHPFDLLKDGQTIDVKASKIKHPVDGTYGWTFHVDWNGKRELGKEYCDFILFLCYDNNWNQVVRSYLIPIDIAMKNVRQATGESPVTGKRYKNGRFYILCDSEEFEQYRIFEGFDIPEFDP